MGRPPKKKIPQIRKLKKNEIYQAPRGTKDILPDEQYLWQHIRKVSEKIFEDYGFFRIETPMFEETGLYERGIGLNTDVVQKEMYTFKDKSARSLTLRPEWTAGIARAYIEHGLGSLAKPLKLFAIGSLFRYERPQAGRMREHHQLGAEIFGEKDPVIDAQLIQLAWNILQKLKLKDIIVHVNTIGCRVCREEYKQTLRDYYGSKKGKLCADCKKRLIQNPLRLLDCKEEKCQRMKNNAPQMLDYLCNECHEHFKLVLEYLDELELPYKLDSNLVRGLDYYTKTVFEIVPTKQEGSQTSIAGGGRYDDLIELLGGKKPTPASGFGMGIERIIVSMIEQGTTLPIQKKYDVYLAQLGEMARRKSLRIFEELRSSGFKVAESFSKGSIKSQLKRANKLGVPLTLILGQKEAIDNTILFRDMESGMQEVVSFENISKEVKKRLNSKSRGHITKK